MVAVLCASIVARSDFVVDRRFGAEGTGAVDRAAGDLEAPGATPFGVRRPAWAMHGPRPLFGYAGPHVRSHRPRDSHGSAVGPINHPRTNLLAISRAMPTQPRSHTLAASLASAPRGPPLPALDSV